MKQKKSNTGGIIIIVCIAISAVITLLIFGMQGKTTTTGGYPNPVSNSSLSCIGQGISYPIATYDYSVKKTLNVDAIFRNDSVDSISLKYTLYYNDSTFVTGSEAHNHAAMNSSFYGHNLDTDDFGLHMQKYDDHMLMTLYATRSDLAKNAAYSYFMLPQGTDTLSDIKATYEKQGLTCTINN